MISIWLDDLRPKPNKFNYWFTEVNSELKQAILAEDILMEVLEKKGELIFPIYISFDHDLGENKLTGYDLAKWIEEGTLTGFLKHPINWHIHSTNPVGNKNISAAMRKCDEYWRNYK